MIRILTAAAVAALASTVVGCNAQVQPVPNPPSAIQGVMNYTDSTMRVEIERVFLDKPYLLTVIVRDGDKFVAHWVHSSPAATGALSIRTDVPADKPMWVDIGPNNHTVVLHVHSLSEIEGQPSNRLAATTTNPLTAERNMTNLDGKDWKHTTAANAHQDPVGIDLFDDEENDAGEPTVSIYLRFADGTRWPARTLTPGASNFATCLASWMSRGPVNDYRTVRLVKTGTKKHGRYVYNVVRTGGTVAATAVPYEYGSGYQVKLPGEPDDLNLSGHVHLGLCKTLDAVLPTALKLLGLVALARQTDDPIQFFRGMLDAKLHAAWPAGRIEEFIRMVRTLPSE